MFPLITHITDLTSKIEGHQEFGIYPNENGTTVICYAIADKDTFRGENLEYKRECRGITFNADGSVAARPLHKFHNVGENEESMPYNILWDRIVRVSTKHDGSMVMPVLVDGKIVMKTKRSFDCKEAVSATKWLHERPEHLKKVAEWVELGCTAIFEWVSPESPIVLTTYEIPELILLQVRGNVTGHYASLETQFWTHEAKPFSIAENHIDKFRDENGVVSWELLRDAAVRSTSEEGWVIQTSDDHFWKVKTDWYVNCHKSCTFLRWRDLFLMARDGQLDDLRPSFVYSGRDFGAIAFVEEYVAKAMDARMQYVVNLASSIDALRREMSDKDVFQTLGKKPMFTHAKRLADKKDVYDMVRKEFFQDAHKQWSLAAIPANVLKDWDLSFTDAMNMAGFGGGLPDPHHFP